VPYKEGIEEGIEAQFRENIPDLAPSGRQHSCCSREAASLIWYGELSL
jgi:hypothetical protein